ncbi:MAG TPA: DUF4097 family beta strand repeat-containing protein, partial [Gammaproteobacteria bacterium]|nr:DUF4097 family beta strand repeat-containing protein [Gammaproteobacteria bacterium]
TRVQCDDHGQEWHGFFGRRRQGQVCEIRELTLPASGTLDVDARDNGSVRVTGWDKPQVLVRAEVRAWGDDEDEAHKIDDQVKIRTDSTIRADGPDRGQSGGRRGWSVNYEIFTPRRIDLRLDAGNGGISIEDVHGDIDFETTNGGVSLSGLGGDVHGRTTNGGLDVTLTGATWDGKGLDVSTTNGGVDLRVPKDYSARLDARTVNGGMHTDIPITVQGRIGRKLSGTLGKGGPLLSVRTTNGGVHVSDR